MTRPHRIIVTERTPPPVLLSPSFGMAAAHAFLRSGSASGGGGSGGGGGATGGGEIGERASLVELELGITPGRRADKPLSLPDAVGYGRNAEGAMAGLSGLQEADYSIVDNGADDGRDGDTLREAVEAPGNRVVAMIHDGPYNLTRTIRTTNGNLTIHNIGGGWARWWDPAGDVDSFGAVMEFRGASDVILNGLKFYRGIHPDALGRVINQGGESGGDALHIADGSTRFVARHCAGLYAIDQTYMLSGGSSLASSYGSIWSKPVDDGWHFKTLDRGTNHGYLLMTFHSEGSSFYHDLLSTANYRLPQTNTYGLSTDLVACGAYNGFSVFGTIKPSGGGDRIAKINVMNTHRKQGPAKSWNGAIAYRTRNDGDGLKVQIHGSGNGGAGANANTSANIDAGTTTEWSASQLGTVPYPADSWQDVEGWIRRYGGPHWMYNPISSTVVSIRDSILERTVDEYVRNLGPKDLLSASDIAWPQGYSNPIDRAGFIIAAETFYANALGIGGNIGNSGKPVTLVRDDDATDVTKTALEWFCMFNTVDPLNYVA